MAPDPLREAFLNPPNAARPRVWWHWMNGNVTKEGIKRDLEWMHGVGIGGLQNFDAQLFTPQVVEKRLSYMTPEWKDAFRYAAELSDQLGLELAIASSAGWSETGGPWVTPEQGIKKFVWSETLVEGGRRFDGVLAAPPSTTGYFQDAPAPKDAIAADTGKPTPQFYADTLVVAYPAPEGGEPAQGRLSSSAGAVDAAVLSDGRHATTVDLPAATKDAAAWLRVDYDRPRTISAATLGLKISSASLLAAHLEASDDGVTFRPAASFPEAGVARRTISFPPVTARSFRIRFDAYGWIPGLERLGSVPGAVILSTFDASRTPATIGVSHFALFEAARVHAAEMKAGFGVAPDYYALETPAGVAERPVAAGTVIDLTGKMSPDGRLDWTPPKGRWKVLRFGWSLTGKQNHPATPEATGLEVDKLDRAAVKAYIETYLDTFEATTGKDLIGKRGLKALLNDSIEVGPMNWTGDMVAQFRRLRGYDPVPWLPVLTGVIVETAARSDAFLFDFRRTIGDLLAEHHYGQIAESAHARGMVHYAEALEFGRPSLGDDMAMRRHADVPMGAMWTYRREDGPRFPYIADLRGAASVAHIYGQNIVGAESLTAGSSPWAFAPADLKSNVDLQFALGVNRPVIHTSVHQPVEKKPGLSLAVFGQYFNRHDTWAGQAKPWVDYLSRSAFMLQQGRFHADVAYFYGEEAPLTGLFIDRAIPHEPAGFGYDFVNPDVLQNHLSVKDGALTTPTGMSYRVLYLGGASQKLTLAVLQRLTQLVKDGATLVGERPSASPSLTDDPRAVAQAADGLWGAAGGQVGRGRVIATRDLNAALVQLGLVRDFEVVKGAADAKLMFVHRKLADGEVYFVSNRQARAEPVSVAFRVTGHRPVLWRADTGAVEDVAYRTEAGRTMVDLKLDPDDAVFVVFREPSTQASHAIPDAADQELADLGGGWSVTFEEGRGAPADLKLERLESLSKNADPGVRYFSGVSTYRRDFDLAQTGGGIWLDLGQVGDLADVVVNGKLVGTSWRLPHRIEVTSAVKRGRNSLEIRVANVWANRLIGDVQPGAQKVAFVATPTYRPDAPLRPSGLIGPVRLLRRG